MKYTLDATNKKLGRLASETAVILMGKNTLDFAKNKIPDIKVEIKNLSKISFDSKKSKTTLYKRYSGYPGGLKIEEFSRLKERKGIGEAFKKTLSGMLPKNKLRAKMIKNVVITE